MRRRFGSLHRAHQMAVPFENLSIHLAEPISLDEDGLLDKIVTRRRGGFCYELNGAFALLLLALGAQVARSPRASTAMGGSARPFDHLALGRAPGRRRRSLAGRRRLRQPQHLPAAL